MAIRCIHDNLNNDVVIDCDRIEREPAELSRYGNSILLNRPRHPLSVNGRVIAVFGP